MNIKAAMILIVGCLLMVPSMSFAQTINFTPDSFSPEILQKIIKERQGESVTVNLAEGYYYLHEPVVLTGSNYKTVVVKGDEGHNVHLVGGVRLTGWEVVKNGLWRCRLPAGFPEFDQLYVNERAAVMARSPNIGSFRLKETGQVEGKAKHYRLVLSEDGHDAIASISKSEHPVITVYRKWTHSRQRVVSSNKKDHSISFHGIDYPEYNPLSNSNTVIISRFRGALDEPGEWLPDVDGYVYYYPREGETIEQCRFHVPLLKSLLQIKGTDKSPVSSIEFRNIVFEGTGSVLPAAGSEPGQASSTLGAAIEIDKASRISFVNCEVRNTYNYALWFRERCFESSVTGCYFHDLGAGAIKIGKTSKDASSVRVTSGIVVDNNVIRDYGQERQNAAGILVLHASDNKITHNDISHGYYSGISVGWTWGYGSSPALRNEIAYNHIWQIGTGLLNDLGGIYTLGNATGTTIHHNRIHDIISGDFRGWGIYLDEGTANILVENNLVYNCTSGGLHQNYGSNNVIRNNIFAFGIKNQVTLSAIKGEKPLLFTNNIVLMNRGTLFSGGAVKSDKTVLNHNCYWNISGKLPSVAGSDITEWIRTKDRNSVLADPLFADPENGDFRFRSKRVYRLIGFKPFDYQSAGVY